VQEGKFCTKLGKEGQANENIHQNKTGWSGVGAGRAQRKLVSKKYLR
jgi:hypothetical protein